jgi:hypothetical protein
MPGIDWQHNEAQPASSIQRDLVSMCDLWSLQQIVTVPTRGSNLLDLIITTVPEYFADITTQSPLVNSDHDVILCRMLRGISPQFSVTVERCFQQADFTSMAACLSAIKWCNIYQSCRSVNDYWSAFYNVLWKLIEAHVPTRKVRRGGQSRSRLPKSVRQLMLAKRKAWRQWKASPNPTTKLSFNHATRQLKQSMRRFLADQENQLLAAGPRKFFAYVSHQVNQTESNLCLENATGTARSPVDICATLNEEFSKNFTSSRNNCNPIYSSSLGKKDAPSISTVSVDVIKVRAAIMRTRSSAAGPDGIPAIIYKKLAYWLSEPLCTLYQQCMHQDTIPDAWRQAKVVPLYKGKGNKSDPASYRPISLTAVASKLLERIIADELSTYMSSNKLSADCQHGFMSYRSTVTNLLQCDTVISQHLNNKHACDVIALDFSRAFDKVSHSILSTKLSALGVCGKLHTWLVNFLTGRTQYVSYRGAVSSAAQVTSGVVQGSVLGPQLFLLFINDLRNCVTSCDVWLYADDVKLVGIANNAADRARTQHDLDAIGAWSAANQLPLCIPKCQCLHLGRSNVNSNYTLCGSTVATVDQLTDLGVLRSSDYSYAPHIGSIVRKATRSAALLLRAFSTRNEEFLMRLFKAYVRPTLEYASPVWSPVAIGLTRDLENVQRRFTKRLCGLREMTYEQRLSHLQLESLEARRRQADLLVVFKALRGLLHIDPKTLGVELCTTSTRANSINININRASCVLTGKSFNYRIGKIWNSLPATVKQSSSINVFKRRIVF